jgi:hypothetical protein
MEPPENTDRLSSIRLEDISARLLWNERMPLWLTVSSPDGRMQICGGMLCRCYGNLRDVGHLLICPGKSTWINLALQRFELHLSEVRG